MWRAVMCCDGNVDPRRILCLYLIIILPFQQLSVLFKNRINNQFRMFYTAVTTTNSSEPQGFHILTFGWSWSLTKLLDARKKNCSGELPELQIPTNQEINWAQLLSAPNPRPWRFWRHKNVVESQIAPKHSTNWGSGNAIARMRTMTHTTRVLIATVHRY